MRGKGIVIGNKAGETMAEVMVSAAIFLLFMAVFQGAVSFCTSAQEKSRRIRENTAAICRALQEADPPAGTDEATFTFYATSADGKEYGNQVFRITALKQSREVNYTDADGAARTAEFAVYGAADPDGGG